MSEERSIRQWFAGQALKGLLTRWGAQDSRDGQPDPRTMEDIITQAYGLADLMIEYERDEAEKKQNERAAYQRN